MPSSRLLPALLGLVLSSALATACLVTFEDYPRGDIHGGSAASGGAATGGSGGAGKGGSGGAVNGGGSGGSANGGTTGTVSLLIDDFEDGNVTILRSAGRIGTWYMGNDGDGGMQLPYQNTGLVAALEPPRGSSERGLHTSGMGFDLWGALVRADFNVQMGMAQPYDLSAYTGVKLWLRSGDDTTIPTRVQIATSDPAGCEPCGDHFGNDVSVTPEWQQVTLPFGEMTQAGFGIPALPALDLSDARGIQVSWVTNVDFDVWIDDVSFY